MSAPRVWLTMEGVETLPTSCAGPPLTLIRRDRPLDLKIGGE